MTLHPAMATFIEASRTSTRDAVATRSIQDRRQAYRQLAAERWPNPTPVAEARDQQIPIGEVELTARVYVPHQEENAGIIVFFHGGSFVVGDLESHDALCRRLCDDLKMRLVAVEYRLAPEWPFPTAVNDAIGSLRFIATHRELFGDMQSSVIVMGDSAGATLAAVAAAATRDEGLGIVGQALFYPTLGPELLTDSAHRLGSGYLLELDQLRVDYQHYLSDWHDHTDARISPLMSLDLTGAPPAVIVVAEYDPLRDEAVAYGGLLEHFSTPVEILEAAGMVHGFLRYGGVVPDALAIVDDLATHVHRLVEVAR